MPHRGLPVPDDEIRQLLRYEPETGRLIWLLDAWHYNQTFRAGDEAGFSRRDGYRRINLYGVQFGAHRLAFFLMTGRWPSEIDHVNRCPSDNRWVNLREATRSQQCANRVHQNATGFKGVFRQSSGRFWTAVKKDGVRHYIGTFDTAEQAHAAYVTAARETFGEFSNAGSQT
jgi:hypothetical protein